MQTETAREPVLIRVARLILKEHGALHVDNFTGRIVHDKKVDRALERMGINPLYEGDEDLDEPIVIKRKKGGPKINPVLLDATTASMIVQIYDGINADNRAKFPALTKRYTVIELVNRLWKLVK